jgi:Met-10+ like-protein
MNFSGISGKTFLGRLLRYPLKFIPRRMKLPILQGRLRGKRWIAGSSTHGCWLGSYEYDQRILFEQLVAEGSVVFDLGAHVGFYTLLAAVLVGPRGKVYAFEPMPDNIYFLKEHLRLNRITNLTVIDRAVSDSSGVATFVEEPSSAMGHFAALGYQLHPIGARSLEQAEEILAYQRG